jgi:hypothetical protein
VAITPHIHIGFVEFLIFFLYFIIASFFVRVLEIWMSQNAVGQALAFIH